MKRRQWTSKQKSQIVLEGPSDQIEVSKLCKWHDQFLQTCHQAFDIKQQSQKEQHLGTNVKQLKSNIDDLTIELKKASMSYETLKFSSNQAV